MGLGPVIVKQVHSIGQVYPTPINLTEAFHLVANVQLLKCLTVRCKTNTLP